MDIVDSVNVMVIMACNNPVPVWYGGINPDTGKRYVFFTYGSGFYREPDAYVPCGNCLGCLLDHAKYWSGRCLMEMQDHKGTAFVTLTYNNEHLVKCCERSLYLHDRVDPSTGELASVPVYSLNLRDIQLWKKRLNKYWYNLTGKRLRYFGCGEYGDESFRPHYHFLVFGLDLNLLTDLHVSGLSRSGANRLYESKIMTDIWSHGNVLLGRGTYNSAGYCARYVLKKRVGINRLWYSEHNLAPPFLNMSRRPGIGINFLQSHISDLICSEGINDLQVSTENGHKTIKVSRYLLDQLALDYPSIVDIEKVKRADSAKVNMENLEESYDRGYMKLLRVQEEDLVARTKIIQRRTKI